MLNKKIIYILLIGLLVRLFFYFFGAEIFFGKEDFFIQGDTMELFEPAKNLVENFVFSTNRNDPNGVYGREPGYSLIMALFYFISFKNVFLSFKLLVFFQIFLDTVCVYLLYKISLSVFKSRATALISALLYAIYPFSILWTSVIYAEIIGVNLMIISLYLLTKNNWKFYVASGMIIAYAALARPQLVFVIVAFIISSLLIYYLKKEHFNFTRHASFVVGFILLFSLWPLRNYLHGEFIVFKKLAGASRFMSADRLNFAYFMWSVKTDWEPQISQLLNGEEVEMPKWVWKISPEDSSRIKKALALSYRCGDGFRQLRKLPALTDGSDCTEEVALMWKELRDMIIKKKPVRFFITVPLSNLKKAIFKNKLIKSYNKGERTGMVQILTRILFFYRTVLILAGMFGIGLMFYRQYNEVSLTFLVIVLYIAGLYFWLCFLYRDMDIRYLLPADVLLLLPGAYFIKEFMSSNISFLRNNH